MRAIVTGANGMLGRNLVRQLCSRADAEVAALVRTDSRPGFQRFLACEALADRVRVIEGELSTGGAPAAEFGDADHVFHLAGRSDWSLEPAGTARAAGLDCQLAAAAAALAAAVGARRLHAPSLIWSGDAPPPVVQVKRAEELTLQAHKSAVRIYRLPVLAGRSDTGEADAHGALNGLYAVIRYLASQLPSVLRLSLPLSGNLQVLPADVAAAALVALAEADLPDEVVTVADPHPAPLREVANVLLRAAGGPQFAAGDSVAAPTDAVDVALGEELLRGMLARVGCPASLLDWIRQPVTPAVPAVSEHLRKAGVTFPAWADHGGRGYRYWQYALAGA